LRCIDTAADLGIQLVTFHVGMIPVQTDDPGYLRVRRAVDVIAAYAKQRGITLGLETGQETAEELLASLEQLETGVGVNFDGANFIAYSTADPLSALAALYPRVVGVHIKDYAPPAAPGLLSLPAPLGQGAARVDETIAFLLKARYSKPLILETYDPVDPRKTIAESRAYVLDLLRRAASEESHASGE
ncbi:MAG TPA: sugar phosphate isomerase/epimerase family protein, partial [Chloroflexota bacterium]|nr:sugar phosphate isomerase/epimerase family protein [Chloroflexota bacterium]